MSRPIPPVDSSLNSDGQILYYNMLGVAFSMFAYATVGITLHLVWETTAFLNTGDGVEFSRVLVEKVNRTQPMILALTVIRLMVVLLPTAAWLALIVFGSYYARNLASLSMNLWAGIPTGPELTCLTLSLAFNVVLTALIICKLLLLRYTARRCGVDVSYLSVAGILIESAFPYAMVSTFTLIALGTGSSWQTSLLPFFGQMQAIPSLLVAVRVLENRAISRQEMAQTMSTVSRSIVFTSPRDMTMSHPELSVSKAQFESHAEPPLGRWAGHTISTKAGPLESLLPLPCENDAGKPEHPRRTESMGDWVTNQWSYLRRATPTYVAPNIDNDIRLRTYCIRQTKVAPPVHTALGQYRG
ncbi:predicted protein [Postia placenta Mad-698-R]|nr:predicted protein [Postia placenta Mad-698-R]